MPIARPGHWWILTACRNHPGYTSLRVTATTDKADHLYMAWGLHSPASREIWRIVRGKRIFCGFKYIWDTPSIEEQQQDGETTTHWFRLSPLPALSTVWYYLFAPGGPYGLEIQGPLMHVKLLEAATWSTAAYFASRTKGMFRTADLSGPGGSHPTWVPDNAGLPFLDLHQATPDPWDPYHRRFVVCHDQIYRMDNIFINEPATATLVLSVAEAVFLTGGAAGDILWIAGNLNYPGHFYVLWRADTPGTGIWCIKTIDYGDSWTAAQVDSNIFSFAAGNIMAGNSPGISPYPPGDVLYATINVGVGGHIYICRSFDEGETWAKTPTYPPGGGIWEPRLYIDPADQSIVFAGAGAGGPDLWITGDHGLNWQLFDNGNGLGIIVSPTANIATMCTRESDPNFIRVLNDDHIWKTTDFGIIWQDQGPAQYSVRHIRFRDSAPDFLYLARHVNAPGPDGLYAQHVLFVSIDEGSNMFGKAGAHADQGDGGGDSIPHNCGGAAHEGILTLPWP